MVILTKKVDMELDELTDNDWTAGTYQDILTKYTASDIKDFPPAHAVDILSIATQSDPILRRMFLMIYWATWREFTWENHRLEKFTRG